MDQANQLSKFTSHFHAKIPFQALNMQCCNKLLKSQSLSSYVLQNHKFSIFFQEYNEKGPDLNGNVKQERGREDILTRRVLERVHFWARPTMEKGIQCVGIKEWRRETVAIPPIVERSSALKLSIVY